jgi:hypothetical protein
MASERGAAANSRARAQQRTWFRRLYASMNRYRGIALSVARPAALAIVAILLILVVLPAALGVQGGASR